MIQFPKNFYWGSATSATQSEGAAHKDGKGESIWDLWYRKEPYKFYNKIGPEDTTKIYENYKEDVKLLKQTGHNSFRTSISWARLIPEGNGEINQKAVDFYRNYFSSIKKEGITLFVNLFHFDMPSSLQEIGGWTNKDVVEYYANYADKAFELFGDIVDRWFTFNEPIVHVEEQYLNQNHYPMEVDPKKAVQSAFNSQLASAKAIEKFRKHNLDSKIGIVLNLTPAYPRSQNPSDLKAARIADLFQCKSFLDPSIHGGYPKELVEIISKYNLMPEYNDEELDIIKNNRIDFLGVNYYQPLRVKENPYEMKSDAIVMPEYFFTPYIMPGRRINKYRGWEIYPDAVYDIAINIRDNYNNIEWLMTENGMGVEDELRFKENGQIQDDYRIEFIKEHLEFLHKGIEAGSNCVGYHLWTFIDCWSWLNAYKNRYGLVELDLETQERTIKKSGNWFKELSKNNGF
ncbi:glycoside hydrolase family 1 protein [Helcococcus sueciensis]|uniref:glycoside hydrolase family 1 protein n=1 Tax=Helcococcus sueciensis TaxID=241555 RepID=UPI0003F63C7C|nr:glycoside hydrolase family 1 protein [Helcococcus sueciensis]